MPLTQLVSGSDCGCPCCRLELHRSSSHRDITRTDDRISGTIGGGYSQLSSYGTVALGIWQARPFTPLPAGLLGQCPPGGVLVAHFAGYVQVAGASTGDVVCSRAGEFNWTLTRKWTQEHDTEPVCTIKSSERVRNVCLFGVERAASFRASTRFTALACRMGQSLTGARSRTRRHT